MFKCVFPKMVGGGSSQTGTMLMCVYLCRIFLGKKVCPLGVYYSLRELRHLKAVEKMEGGERGIGAKDGVKPPLSTPM